MPRFQMILACMTLICTTLSLFAAPPPTGPQALLLRDIEVQAVSESVLPRLHPGDIVVCPAILRDGYLIVMRDSQHELRGALMPFADEWGHSTATAWTHDPTLEKHRLLIRRPAILRPYGLLLKAGDLHPVTSQNDRFVQIEYSCADEMTLLTLPRDAVEIQSATPSTGSAKLEDDLTRNLKQHQEEQARLRAIIDENEAELARISQLLLDLNKAQLDTATLKGEMAVSQALKQTLNQLQPALARQRQANSTALQQTLVKQTRHRQSEQTARLNHTLITDSLTAQQQATVELMRWKTEAQHATAKHKGLQTSAAAGTQSDELKQTNSGVRKAARLQTQLTAQLAAAEHQQTAVTTSVDLLLDLLETNRELLQALQASGQTRTQQGAQLTAIQQELRQVDHALNPPPPPPPGAPTEPPTGKSTVKATPAPTPGQKPMTKPESKTRAHRRRSAKPPVEEKGAPNAVEQLWSTAP